VARATQASGAVDSQKLIEIVGKWVLEKRGKYPVNKNDELRREPVSLRDSHRHCEERKRRSNPEFLR